MLDKNLNKVEQSNNTLKNGDLAGRDIYKSIYNIGRTNTGGYSQIEKLYKKLEDEKKDSQIFSDIIDELLHYKTIVDTEVIGLEQKLTNGSRQHYIDFAETTKEKFYKKLFKNEYSESSQLIFAFLLGKIYSCFKIHIYPNILKNVEEEIINKLIEDCIITPIEDILGENLLRIFEDEIYGMIYYLTGNCHIKWN